MLTGWIPSSKITLNGSQMFSRGLAGVIGNEQAGALSGAAIIDNNLTLDPLTVL